MAFLNTSRDLDQAVAARMERQRVLHHGRHRFYLLAGEQALETTVGDDTVMVEQPRHILELMAPPRALTEKAVHGPAARDLIETELRRRGGAS